MTELEKQLEQAARSAKKKTYATAGTNNHARRLLEARESLGDLRPAEVAELDRLRSTAQIDETAVGQGDAAYRGVQKGATFNLLDEAAGLFGGDEARDAVRNKDADAQAEFPAEFSGGELSGAAMSSMLPGVGFLSASKGMSVLGKMLMGSLVGGGAEGARGFAGGEGGFAPRINEALEPAAWGAGIGAVAPLAAKGAGAGVRRYLNRAHSTPDMSAATVKALKPAARNSEASIGDIQSYLDELGPEAMPADLPGFQHQAMGLSAMGGDGGTMLSQAVNQRGAQSGQRIRNVMDEQITPANAAFDQRRELAQQRTHVLGPEYEAALGAAEPLNTGAITQALADSLETSGGNTTNALQKLLTDFVGDTGGMPAAKLHNVRSDLSDTISENVRAGRGKQAQALSPHLQQMDESLDQVPGYADARTGYANNKAMDRAIDDGQTALRGGRATASSPQEFQQQFDRLSEAQKDAFRTGLRRDIAGLMGTSRNDAAAGWGEFSKEWNAEKLRIALGDSAEPIIQRLKSEKVFSETRGRIDAGSMTSAREASRAQLQAASPEPASGVSLLTAGLSDRLRRNVIDPLVGGPRRADLNRNLGEFFTATGDTQKRMVNDLRNQNYQPKGDEAKSALAQLLTEMLMRGGGGALAQSAGQ